MRKVHFDRLEKLAKHLRKPKLGHMKFDFGTFHENGTAKKGFCGTAGCALGECPTAFPRSWKIDNGYVHLIGRGISTMSSAQIFFDLHREECEHLFFSYTQNRDWVPSSRKGRMLGDEATAIQVSNNILHFIKLKKEGIEFGD